MDIQSIHPSLIEARTPPILPQFSQDNIDWYNEHIRRCFEGHRHVGHNGLVTELTGDHYHFMNFFQMEIALTDKKGKATKKFKKAYPYYSQEDDYLFKQIREAELEGKGVFLFTGRGYGKTYIVLSIGMKIFWHVDDASCAISASGKPHANPTWKKLRDAITQLNITHPTIRKNLLTEGDEWIEAGRITYSPEKITNVTGRFRKVVYDNEEGKTKGSRFDFQHWEEVGDWSGKASLDSCISASRGTWYVQTTILRARVFYTGTGGTVMSNQAKSIFWDPDAYNVYAVKQWRGRKSGIFIPATRKWGDTWIQTGISNEELANEQIKQLRLEMESKPKLLKKFIQEYPLNPDECFLLSGDNCFDQLLLGKQKTRLEEHQNNNVVDTEILVARTGTFWPVMSGGRVIGAEWEQHDTGEVRMYEQPEKDEDGRHFKNLYVAGYDGINFGKEDTESGEGSQGAFVIKKRMNPLRRMGATHNFYALVYNSRPDKIETLYMQVMLGCIYFGIYRGLNIENAAAGIGIVAFVKLHKHDYIFMMRPRITFSDGMSDDDTSLIGTIPNERNIGFGLQFLAKQITDFWMYLYDMQQVEQAINYTYEEKGSFDIISATIMCELGDYDMHDKSVRTAPKPPPVTEEYGYYTEWVNGKPVKRFGLLPNAPNGQKIIEENNRPKFINYIDTASGNIVYEM